MTQAIEILERHRLFLIEVERDADVQDAIKAVVITVKQQAEEIERLRELVKRHEDALKAVFSPLPYIPYIGEAVKFDSIPGGEKYAVRIYMTNESDGSVRARSFKGDTPLDAIEAAMKEVGG